MKKILKTVKTWRIGDYIRQFSIVAAGIIVTFVGSSLITEYNQQKEVASVMQLVKSELEQNRQSVERLESCVFKDQQMSRYMIDSDFNVYSIDQDTLRKYVWFVSSLTSLDYTSDALEVLKNSSLMQQVGDKKMLLDLLTTYQTLEQNRAQVTEFYKLKGDILKKIVLSLTPKDRKKNQQGTLQDRYSLMMQHSEMQNYCMIAADFFDENLFPKTIKLIDDNLRTLSEHYPNS